MANIGIFGGSFNPPHRGHLLAAAEFQRRLGLDRVILMPAALPPHKALAAGSPDARTRLELTRLAAQNLPFAEVSDLELHRSGASYTADTLEELHRQYPNDHLWFLMGTDMLLTFAQWHAPERIAKLASLAVAHRGKDDGRTLREAAQQLRDRFGAEVVLVENDFLPYSSTIARAMLAFRCGEDYLEPAVYDAVCAQGLYHTRRDLRALPLDALARVALPLHDPKRVPHVLGCSHTAAELAARFGEDPGPARRAGLLHDIGKAVDHEMEGTHVSLGVEFCRKYREKEDVLHAIQAHHGDVECKTLVACLVQAADAISAARPGARRENLENYIKRLEKLEEITSSYPGVEKSYAIQAGREVRVMVKPEQVSEDQMVILARELAHRIENELEYPGQIKVHVLRETKAVEYAK